MLKKLLKKSIFVIFLITLLFSSCQNSGKNDDSRQKQQIDLEDALFSDMEKEAREKIQSDKPDYRFWNGLDIELKTAFEKEYKDKRGNREVFENFYKNVGPDAFLDYVEQQYPYCHSQAHELGKTIFAETLDFNKSLNICGNRCTNGCMHGVVAEAMGKSEYKNIMKSVNSLCGNIPGDFNSENFSEAGSAMNEFCSTGEISRLHKKGNCAHAMGHALMMMSENDLEKSIKGCKGFPEQAMGYYCATGVFMEQAIIIYNKIQEDKSYKRESDNYPCDKFTDYPAACYRYTVPLIANQKKTNINNIADICLDLDDAQRKGCFHGLGAAISRFVNNNPMIVKYICEKGDEDEQTLCIEGAIEKLADFSESEALRVCNTLDGKNKDVCLSAAEEKMYRLDKESLDLYCK
ncbi:MAG: hypothetical protein ACRENO_04110 [Thermodesulfobacteriota bacterium]